MNITIDISNRGNYILLSIVRVDTEEVVLTFGNWFKTEDEIDNFKETKLFKNVFNGISKIK